MKGMFRGTEVAVKRLLTTNASKNTIDEFSLEVAIMWYVSLLLLPLTSLVSPFLSPPPFSPTASHSLILTYFSSGLRHPNIIMFMGSCYDPASNEMLLVMELMSRGSLHDVLHNSKVT